MTNRSLAQPPPPATTRETIAQKALRLYPERTVEPLGHGRYSVEGSDGFYEVDLGIDGGEESCPCPAHKPCYHITIATFYRSKARAAARRDTSRQDGGEGVQRKPRPTRGGSVIRAILTGLLFAAPSYFLLFVLAG